MLVTRPDPDASDTAARLAALGIDAETCPLLVHETLDGGLPAPEGFAALALTSAHALTALRERGVLENYLHLPVFTVGDRTAAAARELGFADVVSAGGGFADLAELLAHTPLDGPILYPSARDIAGDLAKSLAPYGRMVITTEVYAMTSVETLPDGISRKLSDDGFEAALFYSRRTAETFVNLAAEHVSLGSRSRMGMLCLSESVAEPLLNAHFVRVGLADHPSEEAMMGLALSFSRDQNDH